uniref:Calcium-dependent protein kinase 11-like n=1 Tax=Tanacetum cinerariifolium TaxID=118510 RepID=A0A699KNK4_TANCI|nr:calcium-dependent protein kinase 11-like [Tanacetum cinerariifolium]
MLDRRPQQRIKAHEVLFAPDKPLDSAVISRLKHFSAMNKLKKMALRVIADRLSEEEIGGLKQMFKMIYADNSGTLTFEELKQLLKRVGSNLMESEIKELMDVIPTLYMNKIERAENLLTAFGFFDKDGSGYITKYELQQAWKDFNLQDAQLEYMIKEAGQDNVCLHFILFHYFILFWLCSIGWTYRLCRICSSDEKRR